MINTEIILADSPYSGAKIIENFDSTVAMGREWVKSAGYSSAIFENLVGQWGRALNSYHEGNGNRYLMKGKAEDAYRNLQSFLTYGFHLRYTETGIVFDR